MLQILLYSSRGSYRTPFCTRLPMTPVTLLSSPKIDQPKSRMKNKQTNKFSVIAISKALFWAMMSAQASICSYKGKKQSEWQTGGKCFNRGKTCSKLQKETLLKGKENGRAWEKSMRNERKLTWRKRKASREDKESSSRWSRSARGPCQKPKPAQHYNGTLGEERNPMVARRGPRVHKAFTEWMHHEQNCKEKNKVCTNVSYIHS